MQPEVSLWMSRGGKVGDVSSWPCEIHTKNVWMSKSHRRCITDHKEPDVGGDGSRPVYVGGRWSESVSGSQRALIWKPPSAYFIFEMKKRAVVIQQYQYNPVTDTWWFSMEAISELHISPKGNTVVTECLKDRLSYLLLLLSESWIRIICKQGRK